MKFKLIGNNSYSILESLKKSLEECNEFLFIVSFIRFSGIQILLDILKKLEEKNIKGKILTSNYMNVTEKRALEKIIKFKNIELKFFDGDIQGFHPKTYIFKNEKGIKILLGSSNISFGGLKSNIEWNNEIFFEKDDNEIEEVLNEYNYIWERSFPYDPLKFNDSNYIKDDYRNNGREIKPNYMQNLALENLKRIRENGGKRALGISATGTGKTYLAVFDIREFKPKRVLFVAHREEILNSAQISFKKIIKEKTLGKYTGNKKELDRDFIFSTIQTLHKNLDKFEKDYFDYIVIDEAHHIGSETYNKILDYFSPKFLLGLTATPERCDGYNIYEVFEGNIPMEIRLREALDNDLVSPFHYFGITDIKEVDLSDVDLNKIDEVAKRLMINKRTDFILEKIKFYGFSGNKMKALGFCANINHAKFMSEEFNKRGVVSEVLTGEDSPEKREEIIKRLEDNEDNLKIIFTVDIFNEGVDIPSINLVLMLRPTNSPIVFIQQLGRGLRKTKEKEFVTVLDFIGNHKKIFLIALALSGNTTYDKDHINHQIRSDFSSFSKSAYIGMDEILKERILEQIENENFNTLKYLKEEYNNFKNYLKRIPSYFDYIDCEGAPNIYKFILKYKSYYNFLKSIGEDIFKTDEGERKIMEEVESYLPLKRIYEILIIKLLLEKDEIGIEDLKREIRKYQESFEEKTIIHSFKNISWDFLDSSDKKRKTKLVENENFILRKTEIFKKSLENKEIKKYLEEAILFGIREYINKFGNKNYGIPFLKLNESYSMREVALLSNYGKLHSSYRNGINPSEDKKTFYLFINLEKDDEMKFKFNNTIIDRRHFTWFTKTSTSIDSEVGQNFIKNRERGIVLHFFIRKFNKIDGITQPFVYVGQGDIVEYSGEKPIKCRVELKNKIDKETYEEFTK
ncbi:DUF3427 domain-containing protein [Fusobacterium sp.]|uniref:DUF3427 domain-containing protein n=1 Tax=Fusobacterium sp. TaxID=68766 RepID=UPI00260CA486|nr:DUF3427 domain-containing protein [Fusobacterium sp.]